MLKRFMRYVLRIDSFMFMFEVVQDVLLPIAQDTIRMCPYVVFHHPMENISTLLRTQDCC